MIIREANLDDTSAIAKVHIEAWRTTYQKIMPDEFLANLSYEEREQRWVKILSNQADDAFTYVVEDEIGQIVGFASGGKERNSDRLNSGEVYAIYILKHYQGQGLGSRLISTIAARLYQFGMVSMLVWVLADNPACRFYQRLGGERVEQKQEEIGGVQLIEVAYFWQDIAVLLVV
ncbi:GCN5-related N-acetyltransferase [Cylindrospermum sp. NIES-4074]|nr:GCN5-related N-acetyltransferase [Cylindrospermum sp. NIES-4074]